MLACELLIAPFNWSKLYDDLLVLPVQREPQLLSRAKPAHIMMHRGMICTKRQAEGRRERESESNYDYVRDSSH